MNFLPFGQPRIIPHQKHCLKLCSLVSRSLVIQSDLFFPIFVGELFLSSIQNFIVFDIFSNYISALDSNFFYLTSDFVVSQSPMLID